MIWVAGVIAYLAVAAGAGCTISDMKRQESGGDGWHDIAGGLVVGLFWPVMLCSAFGTRLVCWARHD